MSVDLSTGIWEEEPEINGIKLRAYDFPSKEKHGKVIGWLTEDDLLDEMELAKAFLYIHAAPISDLCRNIRNKERFFLASEEFFLKFPKKEHIEEFCQWFAKCRELEEAAIVETVSRPSLGKEESPPPN